MADWLSGQGEKWFIGRCIQERLIWLEHSEYESVMIWLLKWETNGGNMASDFFHPGFHWEVNR